MQIGNLIFPTKKSAKDFIREIISKYEAKSSLAAEDFSFVSDLLVIHPESEQKIGCGISRIFIDFDAQYQMNTGTQYILPYRVKENQIQILAIFHGARQWPNNF